MPNKSHTYNYNYLSLFNDIFTLTWTTLCGFIIVHLGMCFFPYIIRGHIPALSCTFTNLFLLNPLFALCRYILSIHYVIESVLYNNLSHTILKTYIFTHREEYLEIRHGANYNLTIIWATT